MTTSTGLRVAVALYSDLTHDSRVLREAESLVAAGHQVTIYCLSWESPGDTTFHVVPRVPDRSAVLPGVDNPYLPAASSQRLLARLARRVAWMQGYVRNLRAWGRWAVEAGGDVDVWHAHDLPALMAVGPFVPSGARLVYDSHEIFLESGTAARMPGIVRRLLSVYERWLARRAIALVTVNEAYADVLQKRLRPRETIIVRNCPPRWDPPTTPLHHLREATGIPRTGVIVLYHGAMAPHRGIEQTVAALSEPGMEDVHLVLLGFGDIDALGLDVDDPRHRGRVHRLPAVSPAELLGWVTDADVDVIALQRTTLNHWLCTPNKLWESLAAGVPVVVSDFPVMREIVMGDPIGPLGSVCLPDQPASIALAIWKVLDADPADRAASRRRCLDAAHDRWNWETEASRLTDLYGSIAARS